MPFWNRKRGPNPEIPVGERVYAIGDIHGEAALFKKILDLIQGDNAARGPALTTIVLLGDVIDRGARGAELVHMLRKLCTPRFVFLKGNHEASMIASYRGDQDALALWLQFGGLSTLAGFGMMEHDIIGLPLANLVTMMRSCIDPELIDWLDGLPLSWTLGDYFFAHAGARPGVALNEQTADDLMWIRNAFLKSRTNFEKIIVHGHTVEPGVPNLGGKRIGLDTGANKHGVLTALGLERHQQWLLQTTAMMTETNDLMEAA